MHATSPEREEAARLLGRIVEESGADGAAFGWTDALAPDWIVPVHAVALEPVRRWALEAPRTFAVLVEESRDVSWYLVVRGVDESRLEAVSGLIGRATPPTSGPFPPRERPGPGAGHRGVGGSLRRAHGRLSDRGLRDRGRLARTLSAGRAAAERGAHAGGAGRPGARRDRGVRGAGPPVGGPARSGRGSRSRRRAGGCGGRLRDRVRGGAAPSGRAGRHRRGSLRGAGAPEADRLGVGRAVVRRRTQARRARERSGPARADARRAGEHLPRSRGVPQGSRVLPQRVGGGPVGRGPRGDR